VTNCSFRESRSSLTFYGEGDGTIHVDNCYFEHIARDGMHVFANHFAEFTMRDCVSVLTDVSVWSRKHVGVQGVANGLIENCEFREGGTGAGFAFGGHSVVRGCTFDGQERGALFPYADVEVEDCTFRHQYHAVEAVDSTWPTRLTMRGCVIEDVEDCSFFVIQLDSFSIQDSDIAHGIKGAIANHLVPGARQEMVTFDMTNNYWGTDEPDSISAWIHDCHDGTAVYCVEYEPFRTVSTPVETQSWSGVKGFYR
jgi:hypothetical protein